MRSMAPNSVTIANGSRICTIASSTLNGLYRSLQRPADEAEPHQRSC